MQHDATPPATRYGATDTGVRPGRLVRKLCLVLLACCGAAQAQLSLSNSRVVFQPGVRQVEMVVTNESSGVVTIRAWVDTDQAPRAPEDAQAPFLVTPPSSRIRPGASQILRVNHTGATPSGDREQLYYLYLLDLAPAGEKGSSNNLMRLDVLSRFKVFVRPAGLRSDPRTAAQALRWRIDPAGTTGTPPQADASAESRPEGLATASGASVALVVNNPSPYFLTLIQVRLLQGETVLQTFEPRMAAPFGTARFAIDAAGTHWQQATAVAYEHVDDYGIGQSARQSLEPAK